MLVDSAVFSPTREAALARVHAVRPSDYARSRNAIEGVVSGLSPYITHGLVSLPEVLTGVTAKHQLDAQHKFVYELGWREYFRHMWLASYVVHVRKVHWRVAADWMYGHLLDGDLASNHLSWQWVAGTGSNKPYLFNADNVARYAPVEWHSPGSVIDQSYEALDLIARQPRSINRGLIQPFSSPAALVEPPLMAEPLPSWGWMAPDADAVAGRDVWLVHPWNLADLPASLSADTAVVGVLLTEFHRAWPWSERRWQFVTSRMAKLATLHWQGDTAAIGAALQKARRVHSTEEPHLKPWLARLATCDAAPALFPAVDRRCDSFSQWWTRASRGMVSAADLLVARSKPAW